MSQEPWNEEIYESAENTRRSRTDKGKANALVFSILAGIFVVIVVAITVLAIYLANGGSNTDSTQEFYNASSASKSAASQSETLESSSSTTTEATTTTDSSSSTEPSDGSTLIVQPGEGQASIAARAGISIADLERLNPEKMTTGSWLAHPGDTVRVK